MTINELLQKQGLSDDTMFLIDKYELDSECQRHAEIFRKIGDLCAEQESIKDEKKDNLLSIEGALCEELRHAHQSRYGEKLSDTRTLQLAKTNLAYKKAFTEYNQAKELFLKLENRKRSLEQRSYMLSNMCNLYNSSYFSNVVTKEKNKEVPQPHAILRERIRAQSTT